MKYLLPITAAVALTALVIYQKRKPKTISVKIEDLIKAQGVGY